jgi:hypothetical protein
MALAYLAALIRVQPAWVASARFAESTHIRLDSALASMPRFVAGTESVIKSLEQLRTELLATDGKYRDAERQIRWLRANLEAEKNIAEQIRLKKAIADQQADAEQLQVTTQRQQRIMERYSWKEKELAALRDTVAAQHEIVSGVHDAHLRVLRSFSDLRGKTSDGTAQVYEGCLRELVAALRFVLQHESEYPGHLKARVARGLRGID